MFWLFLALPWLMMQGNAEKTLTEEDIYKTDEVVFFGLDYTHLRLIHDEGFVGQSKKPKCEAIANKYAREWNEEFYFQKKKYPIEKYFGFSNAVLSQDIALKRNNSFSPDVCIIEDESYQLNEDQLKEIVSHYTYSEKSEGLGLLLVVESMSKKRNYEKFYTVFFDLKNHTLLKTDYHKEKPGGEGFKTYWFAPIYRGLKSKAGFYKEARKKYK